MRSDVAIGIPVVPRAGLWWFGLIELACIAGFVVSLAQGRTSLAWAFLAGPLQFLAWMVLIGDDFHVLLYCAFTFPLAIVAFLPYPFVRYALYPGVIAMLVLSRLVWTARMQRNARPQLDRSERTPVRVLLFMLFFSFAYAVLRGWGNKHMLTYTVFVFEIIVMAYFWATVPRSTGQIRLILFVSALAVVLMAAALPLFTGSSRVGTYGFGGSKVLIGPFGLFDLNTFGGIVAIFAAILTALIFRAERLATRLVLIVVVVILLIALVATRSRGAWLGFGAALLYVVVRARSFWSTMVLATAAVLLLASDILRHTLAVRLAQTSIQDASLAGRAVLWSCALSMARDHWLTGVGMENFRVLKVHYGFPNVGMAEVMRYNAHNVYLEMLADLGIVGLASFLWLLLLRTDGVARTKKDDGAGLAVALNAGLIVFAVHGLWDCLTLLFMVPGMLFGLAMCLRRIESERAGGTGP
jgi:O-antigen ligase